MNKPLSPNVSQDMVETHSPAEESAGNNEEADTRRAVIYRWLGSLFARELSPDMLAAYDTEEGQAFLDLLMETDETLFAELRRFVDPNEASAQAIDALGGDFSRLFLGAGGRHSAPPYQSAYEGEHGRLYGDATGRMTVVLRDLGMQLPDDFPEPADHISIQLDVMALLAQTASQEQQIAFIDTHLIPWLPAFAERCKAFDHNGFYAAASAALVAMIEIDRDRLEKSLDPKK
ncbi:TorA specific chaperone [Cohaesibacter sp. ES.047]|uniref:molecular chaperone TorD n=1 Tax=Cohaesibacter sp. ES.047 TaxID=1798205 RepID=UPI000BB85B13|nr:molecular chaperone TorD [Cohaesibacter sp. ES.047]SNY93258.1 TorA specific chaperone [Cohaesibacter sp. ES.047]